MGVHRSSTRLPSGERGHYLLILAEWKLHSGRLTCSCCFRPQPRLFLMGHKMHACGLPVSKAVVTSVNRDTPQLSDSPSGAHVRLCTY